MTCATQVPGLSDLVLPKLCRLSQDERKSLQREMPSSQYSLQAVANESAIASCPSQNDILALRSPKVTPFYACW